MNGLSFNSFMEEYALTNHEKISKKIASKMVGVMKKHVPAMFYINGCGYYFTPLADDLWGFGSGNMELEIKITDDEQAIAEKLLAYFSKGFTADIAYGGCDANKDIASYIQNFVRWMERETRTEAVECCPECGCENIFPNWDVNTQGYEAVCHECGSKVMLCDECFHAEDNQKGKCDWSEYGGCFRMRKKDEQKFIFLDMDGTLYEWRQIPSEEVLWEEGYYLGLSYYKNVREAVRLLSEQSQVVLYIASHYLPSEYALEEKRAAMKRDFPEIPESRQIFIPYGADKAEYIMARFGQIDRLPEEFILLDDYSKNLHSWKKHGGTAIKLRNPVNGNCGTWDKKPSVRYNDPASRMASKILLYAGLKEASDNWKVDCVKDIIKATNTIEGIESGGICSGKKILYVRGVGSNVEVGYTYENGGLSDRVYHDTRAGQKFVDIYEFHGNKVTLNGERDIFNLANGTFLKYIIPVAEQFYQKWNLELPHANDDSIVAKQYLVDNWEMYDLTDSQEEFIAILNILQACGENIDSLHQAYINGEHNFCEIFHPGGWNSERDIVSALYEYCTFYTEQEFIDMILDKREDFDSDEEYVEEMRCEAFDENPDVQISKTEDGYVVRVRY